MRFVGVPDAHVLDPVKETLRLHLRNALIFALLGRVIVIVKLLTPSVPELFIQKFFAVPLEIEVVRADAGFEKL